MTGSATSIEAEGGQHGERLVLNTPLLPLSTATHSLFPPHLLEAATDTMSVNGSPQDYSGHAQQLYPSLGVSGRG